MIHAITKKTDAFVLGALSVEEIEAWLLANLQTILDSRDANAINMANRIDANLMEFREGTLDVADLIERFESYRRLTDTIILNEATQLDEVQTGTDVLSTARMSSFSPLYTVTLMPAFVG